MNCVLQRPSLTPSALVRSECNGSRKNKCWRSCVPATGCRHSNCQVPNHFLWLGPPPPREALLTAVRTRLALHQCPAMVSLSISWSSLHRRAVTHGTFGAGTQGHQSQSHHVAGALAFGLLDSGLSQLRGGGLPPQCRRGTVQGRFMESRVA